MKTGSRISKFTIIGIILTLFNFAIYTLLARLIIKNNDFLWIASIIGYIFATILAYFLHSKITWKERPATKRGVLMFFFWNGITAIAISPFFTWLFGYIKPFYQFIFSISEGLHLPFDYNFIESTTIFCLTGAVTMILNYFFYDRLVFDEKETQEKKDEK